MTAAAVRAAVAAMAEATAAAIDAVRNAYPRASRWLYDGVLVQVDVPDTSMPGYVWVHMVQHPTWGKSVWAGNLTPAPAATETTP